MADTALPGLYPSLPKAKAPKAPKAKKPCKYGPRLSNGRCPTKPRKGTAVYGDATGDYRTSAQRKADAAKSRRVKASVERAAVGVVRELAKPASRAALGEVAKLPVGDVLKAGKVGAALLSTVALAGIAAYEITKYVITRRAATKEARAQQAYEIGLAYRMARKDAQKQQRGRALSADQQRALAAQFKAQLEELGLSTSNLKGL